MIHSQSLDYFRIRRCYLVDEVFESDFVKKLMSGGEGEALKSVPHEWVN